MDFLLQTDAALDQDRMTMRFVIIALLIVAVLLGLLTVWYWKQTNPNRSNSTISGSARYSDQGYDNHRHDNDYYDPDGFPDDGYRAQPEVYSNDGGPPHMSGDSYGEQSPNQDRRRPVVRNGHAPRRAPAAQPAASSDDAWAAMTGAQDNNPERY